MSGNDDLSAPQYRIVGKRRSLQLPQSVSQTYDFTQPPPTPTSKRLSALVPPRRNISATFSPYTSLTRSFSISSNNSSTPQSPSQHDVPELISPINTCSPYDAFYNQTDVTKQITKVSVELMNKNKIIHNLINKNTWLQSELNLLHSKLSEMGASMPTLLKNDKYVHHHRHQYDSQDQSKMSVDLEEQKQQEEMIENLASKIQENDEAQGKVEKNIVFQLLIQFKKQLEKIKESHEETNELLIQSEMEKRYLKEELNVFKSALDPTDAMQQHMEFLENKLMKSREKAMNLQSKLSLWSKVSKKNQEAKLKAEACVSSMEGEMERIRQELEDLKKECSSEITVAQLERENEKLKDQSKEKEEQLNKFVEANYEEKIHQLEYSLAQKTAMIQRQSQNKEKLEESVESLSIINKQYSQEIKRLSSL